MTQRIIKFRAWYAKEKRMISVDELLNLWSEYSDEDEKKNPGIKRKPDVRVINQSYRGDDLNLVVGRDCELMQFTGLLDKNGKEIYEGDIVTTEGYKDAELVEFVIQHSRAGFQITHPKKGRYSGFADSIEVIGNVYESLEPLKTI